MSYIDSSSLLKTLWEEPESRAVREAIAGEEHIVVSTLTELEVEVQLRAKWLAGATTKARYEFIVIAVSGGNYSGAYIAFSVPRNELEDGPSSRQQ